MGRFESRLFQRLRDVELPQYTFHLCASRLQDGRDRALARGRRKTPAAQGGVSGSHCDALPGADFPRQWRRLDLPDGLQRGGRRRCANRPYLSEYKDFSGIKIATKRRALRRNADGTAIPDPVFVAIDIADVRLS